MINVRANGNKTAYGIKHFVVDDYEDLELIDVFRLVPGSTVIVVHTSKKYMLDSSGNWYEITMGSVNGGTGGSGGGDTGGGGDIDEFPDYDGGSIDGSDPII